MTPNPKPLTTNPQPCGLNPVLLDTVSPPQTRREAALIAEIARLQSLVVVKDSDITYLRREVSEFWAFQERMQSAKVRKLGAGFAVDRT